MRPPADLACPICRGTDFRREHTRLPGKQLEGLFRATLMICAQCSHMLFFEGWDENTVTIDPETGAVV